MHARHGIAAGAILIVSASLPAFGQTTIPVDPTPQVADRTDYIAKSGKTVPKPDKLDPNETMTIQRRTPQ